MVRLTKRFEFQATHYLTGMAEGHACATEHGHDYAVEFTLEPKRELVNGLVVDSGRLKVDLWPVLNRIKGRCLNSLTDIAPWSVRLAAQPSVEHLAMYFWDACGFLSNGGQFKLVKVRVYESAKIWAEVSE
jgi:6-pyruvoyltetrahydropterin/6-carboxytetrahydropterin synthase